MNGKLVTMTSFKEFTVTDFFCNSVLSKKLNNKKDSGAYSTMTEPLIDCRSIIHEGTIKHAERIARERSKPLLINDYYMESVYGNVLLRSIGDTTTLFYRLTNYTIEKRVEKVYKHKNEFIVVLQDCVCIVDAGNLKHLECIENINRWKTGRKTTPIISESLEIIVEKPAEVPIDVKETLKELGTYW